MVYILVIYKYHQRCIFESFKLLQQSFSTILRAGKLEDQRIFHCLAPVFCKWMWIFHSKHRLNKPVPNMFWRLNSVHIQLPTSAVSPENPQQFRLTPRAKLTKHSQKEQQHAVVGSRANPLWWRASTQWSQHHLSQLSLQEVNCCVFTCESRKGKKGDGSHRKMDKWKKKKKKKEVLQIQGVWGVLLWVILSYRKSP